MTNNKEEKLPLTEELDFHYLLQLMPVLHNVPEFSWLAELFVIIGHRNLIDLCKYCGGETIKLPTLEMLADDIEALQWFYDTNISRKKSESEVPKRLEEIFFKIKEEFRKSAKNSDELRHQENE